MNHQVKWNKNNNTFISTMSDGIGSNMATDGRGDGVSSIVPELDYVNEQRSEPPIAGVAVDANQALQVGSVYQVPPPEYQQEQDDIVQVVYQSNQNGSLIGVESSLISGSSSSGQVVDQQHQYNIGLINQQSVINEDPEQELRQSVDDGNNSQHQQARPVSTLPPVAEESTSSTTVGYLADDASETNHRDFCELGDESNPISSTIGSNEHYAGGNGNLNQQRQQPNDYSYGNQQQYNIQYDLQYSSNQQHLSDSVNPIYSTVNKSRSNIPTSDSFGPDSQSDPQTLYENTQQQQQITSTIDDGSSSLYTDVYNSKRVGSNYVEKDTSTLETKHSLLSEQEEEEGQEDVGNKLITEANLSPESEGKQNIDGIENISQIVSRQKQGGAAESGSLRNPYKKKLGLSISTNENDLIAHRQKLLESQEANSLEVEESEGELSSLPKFKRTHSVSFNVGSSRAGRHSVDIRNLPSYLTVKRASIVDVAKGAMSSLMHSFGSGVGSSAISSQRRDSSPDEEPIFEEPIAPTLSLGQRVALVKSSGAEFGTVGWIGQLPDVDDDWIVGVIFDNMIGNSDGAYNGIRYFYARENYAMFVPLSTLTKTDNYIGRPETGTMLSRMSVSLKPGQLISIQRSSIRLQHCFLNAPHQRVGHDVRAVSNRLHCQCHNCGPCAHLTKQGRVSAIPPFGAHHAPNKKNSLAHAAVEILAHHHHHYHEEEHKEEDYQFGDNAAHACNFVRYSCCQQTGTPGHDLTADCGMVRPELLDNLIHAPRAPHRRHHMRHRRQQTKCQLDPTNRPLNNQQQQVTYENRLAINDGRTNYDGTMSTLDGTIRTWDSETNNDSQSSYSSYSSSRSSSRADDEQQNQQQQHQLDLSSYMGGQGSSVYNTIDTRMSLIDQQRFVYQRESSTFVRSHLSNESEQSDYRSRGLGSSIRRCFACITGRKSRDRRPKKRKLSRKERKLEYRRRQFTFVPSTLAKPHEDLATHSILTSPQDQGDSNSDYSSYSKSSGSSRSNSPNNQQYGQMAEIIPNQQIPTNFQQQSMTMEHGVPSYNDNLKSSHGHQTNNQINYDDYTFSDGYGSYEKNGCSYDSALTDQGYFETLTSNSSDTLKQIVEQTINEQVAPVAGSLSINGEPFSPIISVNESNLSEQIDISSPTASLVEEENVCQRMGHLDLNSNNDPPNH